MVQHQILQVLIENMGIDLGRGDIGMTQQRLDHPQVRPARQKVGGKGVAQLVRSRFWTWVGPRAVSRFGEKPCPESGH